MPRQWSQIATSPGPVAVRQRRARLLRGDRAPLRACPPPPARCRSPGHRPPAARRSPCAACAVRSVSSSSMLRSASAMGEGAASDARVPHHRGKALRFQDIYTIWWQIACTERDKRRYCGSARSVILRASAAAPRGSRRPSLVRWKSTWSHHAPAMRRYFGATPKGTNPLRSSTICEADVVQQRPGLEAVQLELAERERAGRRDGSRRDAAAAALAADPVADVRALERAAHDVRDRDLARELAAFEDQEAEGGAGGPLALDLRPGERAARRA